MLSVRYDVYVCLCVSVNTYTYVYGLHTHAHNYIADESLCGRSSWMLSVRDHTHTREFLHPYVYIQRDMFSFLVGQAMLVHMYTYMYTHMHNTWMYNTQHRSSASQRIDHN